jgi:hypothetical protein
MHITSIDTLLKASDAHIGATASKPLLPMEQAQASNFK